MRTTLSLTLILSACLSTSPDKHPNRQDADASTEDNGSLNLVGGHGGSPPVPDGATDGAVAPDAEPEDGGVVSQDGEIVLPDGGTVSPDSGVVSDCTLFADTFERPNGDVGDAEYPSGVTWAEHAQPMMGLSEYAILDGRLKVATGKWSSLDATLPERLPSADGVRARFAAKTAPVVGSGVYVQFMDGTTESVRVALVPGEFQVVENHSTTFSTDPSIEYFVEMDIDQRYVTATVTTGGYASDGGTEAAKIKGTLAALAVGAYDRVRVTLGDGATLDEVFVEKYPCE